MSGWRKVQDNVRIPLAGGLTLSARIWFPRSNRPAPAILEYHPYPKRYATAQRDEIAHGFFASKGFVSLRVDMRGSGESEGSTVDEYTDQERADAVEVINWIARQDWCSGSIGMYGLSWGGFNSLQLAAMAPPPLKAVAVAGATDDRFREDAHFLGGVTASDHIGWSVALISFLTRPPDPALIGRGWRAFWKARLEALEWALPHWLEHQARDAFWIKGFPSAASKGLRVPVLVAGGTADVFATSVLRIADRQPERVKAVIGPWAHKFPHMGIPGPAIDWLAQCTRWFDRWLKGTKNGAETDPRLRVFMTDSYPPSEHSQATRPGRWIRVNDGGGTATAKLALSRDGRLGGNTTTGKIAISTPQDLGMDGGEIMPMGWGADLPGDQRHDDACCVTFDTAPLQNDREIFGRPELTLRLASDQAVAFCVARLCDVAPDGRSTRIAIGAANLNLSPDMGRVRLLKPGKIERIILPLGVVAHRFSKGHRIRIALSNTYWPMLWPSPKPGTLTLHLKGSDFTFTGLPKGSSACRDFGPPDGMRTRPWQTLAPASFARDITRDVARGRTCLRIGDQSALERSGDHGLEHWSKTDRAYEIEDGRPDTATFRIHRQLGIRRVGFEATTEVDATVTSDETHFHWRLEMQARSDGRRVAHKQIAGKTARKC